MALVPLAALVHSQLFAPVASPIERRASVREMLAMLLKDTAEPPLSCEPLPSDAADNHDSSDSSGDDSSDEGEAGKAIPESGAGFVRNAIKRKVRVASTSMSSRRRSLDEEIARMRVEVEEELEAEIQGRRPTPREEVPGSLNPLAGILGPVQLLLGQAR